MLVFWCCPQAPSIALGAFYPLKMLPDHQLEGDYFQHQHAKLEINENLLPPWELYELAWSSLLKQLSSAGISQTAMQ
jgi:hypothetical protein